ncbi:hypothetical protein ACO2Q1_02765 [Brevundimonas sp. VNH65]|uniref:hypothetical protein n=1 Tax=Brevundimonas sp. VNH65 TaxID=3400917 RepID=UPI003BFEFACC
MTDDEDEASSGRRKLLLYVHGFDPRGPGVLHDLQRQDAVGSTDFGGAFRVGRRRREPHSSVWRIDADWPEGVVSTEFVAFRWDDLVRARWGRSLRAQAGGLARWLAAYWRTGTFGALISASRTTRLAVLALPAAVLAFCVAAGLAAAFASWALALAAARVGLPTAAGLGGLAVLALAPSLWRRFDRWANLCWLGRGHLHMVDLSQGRIPELDERLQAFSDRLIVEAASGRWEDIIVVGHSSGSIHAVDVVGRALMRHEGLGHSGTPIRLITIGHCIAPYAKLGPAPSWSRALDALVAADDIGWTDISAPADPGAAGVWHPLLHTPHQHDIGRVRRLSPHFHRALSPERFRTLKRDPMAYHFQYMRSSDHPEVYDWRRIAFGPDRMS